MTENGKTDRINLSMPSEFVEKLDEICLFKNLKRSEWARRKIDADYKEMQDQMEH